MRGSQHFCKNKFFAMTPVGKLLISQSLIRRLGGQTFAGFFGVILSFSAYAPEASTRRDHLRTSLEFSGLFRRLRGTLAPLAFRPEF